MDQDKVRSLVQQGLDMGIVQPHATPDKPARKEYRPYYVPENEWQIRKRLMERARLVKSG